MAIIDMVVRLVVGIFIVLSWMRLVKVCCPGAAVLIVTTVVREWPSWGSC